MGFRALGFIGMFKVSGSYLGILFGFMLVSLRKAAGLKFGSATWINEVGVVGSGIDFRVSGPKLCITPQTNTEYQSKSPQHVVRLVEGI